MSEIKITEVTSNFKDVAELVGNLLTELDPNTKPNTYELKDIARSLLETNKMWAFIAKFEEQNIGVITMHECAAIYAGGIFGEISELYVIPEYRSANVGELLVKSAICKGNQLGWNRLEVGTPPPDESPRTLNFYKNKGFQLTGARLKLVLN